MSAPSANLQLLMCRSRPYGAIPKSMDKQRTTELASKLRECKPLAVKLESFGLDITLTEPDITSIREFEELWGSLDRAEQVVVLAQSGLGSDDIAMLVELIRWHWNCSRVRSQPY